MRNEEPVFPWDRADFRHHVLRLVREYVPAIMEELHTIADLRDPDQIRRDSDAGATRWPRDQPWITRTMHRTVRVWPRAPAMRASRQWGPVLPEDGWRHRRAAHDSPTVCFQRRRPLSLTARIVRSRALDRGPYRDTWAVLVGGTTTVAPRAPAAS